MYLQQYAYHPVDTYCDLKKQFDLLKAIKEVNDIFFKALESGKLVDEIINVPGKDEFARAKFEENYKERLESAIKKMKEALGVK